MSVLGSNRDFQRLLAIGALQSIARWLELLALGVYVFDVTRSPLVVTLVTLVKLAPLALFGPLGGALTSRWRLRSLYLAGLGFMIFTTLAAVLLSLAGDVKVWQVLLISFLGGVFWVLDFPIRRSMIGDVVPANSLGQAMAFDTIANNGTRALGPVLGGVLLQYTGLPGMFLLTLLLYTLCFLLCCGFTATEKRAVADSERGLVNQMQQGFRIVSASPIILATLLVTVVYNLFAFPMLSLVPVLGRDELRLSASVIGMLASMEGMGALLGGLLFLWLGKMAWYRKIYVFGLAGFLLFGFVYAVGSSVWLIALALLVVGIGSACFAAMQTTLLILNSSARHRSQVFGLLSLSIGTGLIGFTLIGLMASELGTRPALITSAVSGLLALGWICWRWPEIMGTQGNIDKCTAGGT